MSISDKIMAAYIVIVLIVLGLMVQERFFPQPDFKVGDCIRMEYEAKEFEPRELSTDMHEIVQLGSKRYKTLEYWVTNNGTKSKFSPFGVVNFLEDQDYYVKVNCKTGEEL